jgi:hypothetical protein
VFVPFWMTGPVVGAIIGVLLGLKPRVNLAVVLSATYVAIFLWALLLDELHVWAEPQPAATRGCWPLWRSHCRRRPC